MLHDFSVGEVGTDRLELRLPPGGRPRTSSSFIKRSRGARGRRIAYAPHRFRVAGSTSAGSSTALADASPARRADSPPRQRAPSTRRGQSARRSLRAQRSLLAAAARQLQQRLGERQSTGIIHGRRVHACARLLPERPPAPRLAESAGRPSASRPRPTRWNPPSASARLRSTRLPDVPPAQLSHAFWTLTRTEIFVRRGVVARATALSSAPMRRVASRRQRRRQVIRRTPQLLAS